MLARRTTRKNLTHLAAAIGLGGLAACSTLPPATYPAFVEHDVAAEFVVPAGGRLRLPMTSPSLVVQKLDLQPMPLGEQFDTAGGRWFVYPAGTAVRVRCSLRAYAAPDGRVPALHEILHDARRIETLEAP